jgi:two-component system, cell cycle response regulator DivK
MTENFDAATFLSKSQSVLDTKNVVSSNENILQLENLLHDIQPWSAYEYTHTGNNETHCIPFQPENNISNASVEGVLVQQAEDGVIKTYKKVISGYNWKNKKIVIVEDDDHNIKYLQTVLRRTGVTIYVAIDGTSFRELLTQVPDIHLILMDIQLPVEDGWQLTRFVKSVRNEIPVIAQTAYGMESDKIKSLEAGCDNFIAKPISPDDLLQMIALYLEK